MDNNNIDCNAKERENKSAYECDTQFSHLVVQNKDVKEYDDIIKTCIASKKKDCENEKKLGGKKTTLKKRKGGSSLVNANTNILMKPYSASLEGDYSKISSTLVGGMNMGGMNIGVKKRTISKSKKVKRSVKKNKGRKTTSRRR